MAEKWIFHSRILPLKLHLNGIRCPLAPLLWRESVLYAECCMHVCTVLYFQSWCGLWWWSGGAFHWAQTLCTDAFENEDFFSIPSCFTTMFSKLLGYQTTNCSIALCLRSVITLSKIYTYYPHQKRDILSSFGDAHGAISPNREIMRPYLLPSSALQFLALLPV